MSNIPTLNEIQPFAETEYAGRFFATLELTQRFNLIRHLIQNSEQLVLVLSESGYGKTSLLNQLRIAGSEHWWVCPLSSSPAISPDALTSHILAAFKVRHEGKSAPVLKESLRSHIASARYHGQLPVLLVDDAHLLPIATLKMLVELVMQTEQVARMRVVLFCEPQITSILATPEFEIVHKTLVHTLDIPPFSQTQVSDYILFRLQNTGYTSVHPFNNPLIKKIYIQSEGIPAKINKLAYQALERFLEQQPIYPVHRAKSYKKLALTLLLFLTLVAAGAFSYWQYPELFRNVLLIPTEPLQSPAILSPPTLTEIPHSESVAPTNVADAPKVLSSEPNVAAPPAPVKSEKVEIPPVKPETSHKAAKDETWLLQQPPESYTIQLLGAYDTNRLDKFRSAYSLSQLAVFKTRYQNHDWYVLVMGMYLNREQAQKALDSLPNELKQETQPWIRSVATIHSQIKKR
jgi:DamX protein